MSTNEQYIATVQVDIDAIIEAGDITSYVESLSLLFNGKQKMYIGSDNKPHSISYQIYNTTYGIGYLPMETEATIQASRDKNQNKYSMKPLIDYVESYNTLLAYETSNNTM